MSNQTIELTYENDEGEEVTLTLPAKNEVCYRCEGYGTHLTPSIGEHAYSMEEFYEEFDEEGREEYFRRGGIYDVTCEACKGKNVLPEVDEAALNDEQKKQYALYQVWKDQQDQADAEYRAEARMERLMGC